MRHKSLQQSCGDGLSQNFYHDRGLRHRFQGVESFLVGQASDSVVVGMAEDSSWRRCRGCDLASSKAESQHLQTPHQGAALSGHSFQRGVRRLRFPSSALEARCALMYKAMACLYSLPMARLYSLHSLLCLMPRTGALWAHRFQVLSLPALLVQKYKN